MPAAKEETFTGPNSTLVRLRARPETIYVAKGRTVLATGTDGFLWGRADQGLFVHETRLLSHYQYKIDGRVPYPVSLSNLEQHSWLGYYLAPAPWLVKPGAKAPSISGTAQQAIELRVSRYVGEGLHEDVDVTNFAQKPVSITLTLKLDADFADQDETREERQQHGTTVWRWIEDAAACELIADYRVRYHFDHQGETGDAQIARGLKIRITQCPTTPTYNDGKLSFAIALQPRESWHVCLDLIPLIEGEEFLPHYRCRSFHSQATEYDRRTRIFLSEATRFSSAESGTLAASVVGALEQGKRDLATLRLFDLDCGERAWTVAAGLPLYIALFGRDTLTAAWESAPVSTGIMRGTLAQLAERQGKTVNDWRDEQPGRMLHEARTGPLASLNFTPRARYYGSITTSAFYPFVVAQLWHWTADKAAIGPFIDPAVAALKWLDTFSDPDHNGFHRYRTRSERGLENQAWKDSGDAIVYEDGSQVPKPIATCEEQGIVYAAKMNLAELLWWVDRKDEAKAMYRSAKELKKRFHDAFWMEDEGFYAMALDPDGRQVRSIGSNALHCVATGIAKKAVVTRTLQRLFAEDMFSGWGVRTLASSHPAYNPYSYHRGCVWPVEHGPFAVGAYRYGCHDEVGRICRSQFETAALFDFCRLPECITGHHRDADHPFPAVYPAANSPQAWSATTPYTLLQAMLGLQPYAPFRLLFVDPFLPAWLPEITIAGLAVADASVTIRFFRKANGKSGYEILEKRGCLHVVRQPSPWSLTASFGERLADILRSFVPR